MNEIFAEENIFFIEEGLTDKNTFLKIVAEKAAEKELVSSKEACLKGLLEREQQQTTGFQEGFAIPHCKNDTVYSPKLMYFKTAPIPWDSLDGNPITDSFVLLIPEKAADEHLKYLALLSRALIDDEFRSGIKASRTQNEIYQLICQKLGVK
ncbi:PTS transporter subunit EIIA [Listeria aquatica]|uniref:PTS transporter subunit EIIA n=1 Tax=Listeria aquatica TaxID=1494960 RepID=A0A841ZRZ1_9LIST|nr:fructose PTS transporter subunit IIA [Listeria aquatica]MBC1522048.1 PTS transporter subunit EIIA [Listeria aquatica]